MLIQNNFVPLHHNKTIGEYIMSTPSRIILKVRKEDIGRKIKFDPTKLPTKLNDWVYVDEETSKVWKDEKGKEKSKAITLKGDYIAIYCHWDGADVGDVLKKCYKDYETALNLLVGGYCSGIYFNEVVRYGNRLREKWIRIKPIQGSLDEVRDYIYGKYEYVFKNNKWVSKKC